MAHACIDTHILIWGVQGVSRPTQSEMIVRAKALLAKLDKENVKVVVPSIVVGEFLLGLPVEQQPAYQELVSRRFIVVPYDLRAAIQFSRIWHSKKSQGEIEAIKQNGLTRNELRADTMIVATAVASGASAIFGFDKGVQRLSDGFIPFEDVSAMLLQTPLPEIE